MSAIIDMTAGELLRRYRDKTLSPREATQAVLDRIEQANDAINAFNLVDAEAALAAAGESEARWQAGAPAGRLDGVPISIKDLMLTKGWPTLRGSLTTDPAGPWDEDAPCVARLREHGAVLLGKTTTPEYGWKGLTDCKVTGVTRNPWNLAKTPGGSSGGASAALAARMGPLAMGSDGGGSIRIPAGFAGVFGLKPNFGRVPAWPPSPMGSLSHHGPMSRDVTDAALLLSVIAEPDPRDWMSLPAASTDFTAGIDDGIAGLRIAYSRDLGFATVDPEVAAAIDAAARAFEELGANVEAVDPPIGDPTEDFRIHWWVGAAGGFGDYPQAKLDLMEPELVEIIEDGKSISATRAHRAAMARCQLGSTMRQFHQTYDLLLTPALAVAAFDVERLAPAHRPSKLYWLEWTPFTYPFNMTQQPACSIPAGFTPDGLPVGLQIVADNFREDLVLRAARAFETARPFNANWPEL